MKLKPLPHLDLSLVIPAFNEAENLRPLVKKIQDVFARHQINYEILIVDDGSQDSSFKELEDLSREHSQVGFISLKHNYGHQVALLAGLKACQGKVAISLDADFQHPPELLPELYFNWLKTPKDIIQTRRQSNLKIGSFIKRMLSVSFYKIMNLVFNCHLTEGGADFRLMGPKVLRDLKETTRSSIFLRGFCSKACYRKEIFDFQVDNRLYGESKYTIKKQIELAVLGIREIVLEDSVSTIRQQQLNILKYQPPRNSLLNEFGQAS